MKDKKPTKKPGVKQSSTHKAVDDFLAASTVPAGHQAKVEHEAKNQERLKELKEKYMQNLFTPSVQINFEQLGRIYIICSVFSGMAAGTFGLAAFEGIFFWLLCSFVTATLVSIKLMLGPKDSEGNSKFFKNSLQVAFSHSFGNSMTYLIFWIMFFNVVH